jgi:hypothetical protein
MITGQPGTYRTAEEGRARLVCTVDEGGRRGKELLIGGRHPCPGQRTGVFDLLPALAVTPPMQHTARPELLSEFGILWIILGLGLLLGIEDVRLSLRGLREPRRPQGGGTRKRGRS